MTRARPGKPPTEAPSPPPAGEPPGPAAADPPAKPSLKERRRRRDLSAFQERIGYQFSDPALLEQALTHISALSGARNRASCYQRLEFLGDHVLGLIISDMLFRTFAKTDEGAMSRLLTHLDRRDAFTTVDRGL